MCRIVVVIFFFKQKTAYEMRISDWSSDVCSSDLHALGGEAADTVDQVLGATLHELDGEALADDAVDDPHEDHHAKVGIVPRIDEHRLQRLAALALGRRDLGDDRLEHFGDANARFGAGQSPPAGIYAADEIGKEASWERV